MTVNNPVPNLPIHPWYQLRNHVKIPRLAESKAFLDAAYVGGTVTPPTLDDQVEAILAGTLGFALDPLDLDTMSATFVQQLPGDVEVPAVRADIGQRVATMRSKWGLLPGRIFSQIGAGRGPTLGEGYLQFVRANQDALQQTNVEFVSGATGYYAALKVADTVVEAGASQGIFGFASSTQSSFFALTALATGAANFGGHIVDPPPSVHNLAVPGFIDVAQNVDDGVLDWTTGEMTYRRNGAILATRIGNVLGAAPDGALSVFVRLGTSTANNPSTVFATLKLGRCVFLPRVPTDEERAIMTAWVDQPMVIPPPPLSLDEQVEALLSNTTAYVLDTQDLATLFQDYGKTNPVLANGDGASLIDSKWGNAVQDYRTPDDWAGSPSYQDGTLVFSAADSNMLGSQRVRDLFWARGQALLVARVTPAAPLNAGLMHWSTGLSEGDERITLLQNADGSVSATVRRLDTDAPTTITTAPGLLAVGVAATVSLRVGFADTGLVELWVNGANRAFGTLPGAPGIVSGNGSLMHTHGSKNGLLPFNGQIGRCVICQFQFTETDRATFEAWVAET